MATATSATHRPRQSRGGDSTLGKNTALWAAPRPPWAAEDTRPWNLSLTRLRSCFKVRREMGKSGQEAKGEAAIWEEQGLRKGSPGLG